MPTMLRLSLIASITLCASAASAQTLDQAVAQDLTLTAVLQSLNGPTAARWLPDGRLVYIEQGGGIYVWTGSGMPTLAGSIPVTQTAGEQGLLGLGVDPMFATSNRLYFYYSLSGSPIVTTSVLANNVGESASRLRRRRRRRLFPRPGRLLSFAMSRSSTARDPPLAPR